MIYFSVSKRAFYDSVLFSTFPDDAIAITDEQHQYLINGIYSGKEVALNANGELILVDRVVSPAEQLAMQSVKLQQFTQLAAAQKTALTNRVGTLQDAIEMEMATDEEIAELPVRQEQLTAWKKYAILLGRVTTQAGWFASVVWPDQPAAGMDLSVSAVAARASAT